MVDSKIEELERRWAETGAIEDEVALRLAQQRAGSLSEEERLELQELQLRAGLLNPVPYPLLLLVPAARDEDEDLPWFLDKARFSYKALDSLESCQNALVERRSLRAADGLEQTYEETLSAALPPLPPHPTPQPWLDQAFEGGVFEARVLIGAGPRHPRERYDNWTDSPCPGHADLLHDALVFCWRRWSGATLLRLTRELRSPVVKEGWTRFNSLDLVAAMLFTIAAWSAPER